jgi:hypothetical protein
MHMFLFKEEEHVDTYIWELQDTVWGQRISASGPRVLLPEIQKRINAENVQESRVERAVSSCTISML